MTADDKAKARRRVESTRLALDDLESKRQSVLARRNTLFVKLVDEGVPQAELARWAGLTQQAVAFAIAKARDAA